MDGWLPQITEPLTDDEVEQKADVLCLVFDPADAQSYELAEELGKKLPASVPRVLLGLKAKETKEPAAEGDGSTKEAPAKQFPGAVLCADDKGVQEAMALLVSTALRPYVACGWG